MGGWVGGGGGGGGVGGSERGYKSVVCTMEIPSCLVGRTQLSSPAPNPSSGPDSPVVTTQHKHTVSVGHMIEISILHFKALLRKIKHYRADSVMCF